MTQDNNYKINNPEAKEQVERKAEHLDTVLEQGNQIEKETQGTNPDWKAVKDLHAGTAPVDKILFDKEVPVVEEIKQEQPEQKTPDTPQVEQVEKSPETPQPEIKKDEPQPTPEVIKEQPNSQPEPVIEKKRDEGGDKWKGYTDRI